MGSRVEKDEAWTGLKSEQQHHSWEYREALVQEANLPSAKDQDEARLWPGKAFVRMSDGSD